MLAVVPDLPDNIWSSDSVSRYIVNYDIKTRCGNGFNVFFYRSKPV